MNLDRHKALGIMGRSDDDNDANDDDDDDDNVLSDYDFLEEDPGELNLGGRGGAGARGSTAFGESPSGDLVVGNRFVCDTPSCVMAFARFDDLVDHRRLHVGCTILTGDDMQWRGQHAPEWGSTPGQTHAVGDIKLERAGGGSQVAGGGACKSESGSEGALDVESSNDNGLLDDDAEFGENAQLGRGRRGRETKLTAMGGNGQLSAREMRRVAGRTERMERSSRIAATERRNRRQVRVGSMTVKTEAERERVLALRVG